MRRRLLNPLGRHVFDLLQKPEDWSLQEERMHHKDGPVLMMSRSLFDLADERNDHLPELRWLDRMLLWPVALGVRDRLKYPQVFKDSEHPND